MPYRRDAGTCCRWSFSAREEMCLLIEQDRAETRTSQGRIRLVRAYQSGSTLEMRLVSNNILFCQPRASHARSRILLVSPQDRRHRLAVVLLAASDS